MKKNIYSNSLLAILLGTFSTAFAQIDPPCVIPDAWLCDDFDAYVTGDPLGPQASWWSTWDGIEGTAEDGTVSDDHAFTGTNSLLVAEGGVTDVVLKLGDQSSGNWHLAWHMYVPDGSTGYFNVQETEVPGVAWNLELMFALAGTGIPIDYGTGTVTIPIGGPSFTYPVDEWFMVESNINLDDDIMEIYVDGILIYTDVYFGNIGSVDFYSIDAANRYYIDDVVFIENDFLLNTYYADTDDDGYGDIDAAINIPGDVPDGYVVNSDDCDDTNADVNPDMTEICNDIDDNCNGNTDEGLLTTYYADADGDTYGDAATTDDACLMPDGFVADATDCDDTNADIYPGATEIANGVDDNCNEAIDEGVAIETTAGSDLGVSVFPVPSNGNFTLQLTNYSTNASTDVTIYSAAGQLVYSSQFASVSGTTTKEINIGLNAAGIYVLNVISGSDIAIRQIVIE